MWWRSTQDKQEVERKLRDYFRSEADSGQPSPQWWDKALSDLGQQRRPPKWRSALAWFVGRPVPALAASIATVVVVAGFSVLLIGRLATDSPLLPKDSSTAFTVGTPSPAPEQNANDNKLEMAAGAIPSTPSPVPPTPSPAPAMLREGWQPSGLPTSPVAGQDMSPVGPYPTPRPGTTPIPMPPTTPTPRPGAAPVPATPPPAPPMAIPGPRREPWRATAKTDKLIYAPGETIVVSITGANGFEPLELRDFPGVVSLELIDTPSLDAVPVEVVTRVERLLPGQELKAELTIPGTLTASVLAGRYLVQGEITAVLGGGGAVRVGYASNLFTILPPQGALQKTITLNEVRESQGIKITLKSIEAAQEKTTIVTVAVPPDYRPPEGPISFPRGMMQGRYRVDGGVWRAVNAAYRDTEEGVRLEWILGPIPADAKTFEFAVTAFAINPGQTATGPWEWRVSILE